MQHILSEDEYQRLTNNPLYTPDTITEFMTTGITFSDKPTKVGILLVCNKDGKNATVILDKEVLEAMLTLLNGAL